MRNMKQIPYSYRRPNLKQNLSPNLKILAILTPPTSKTKGISILLSKNLPFQISDTLVDEQGCYVFLKDTLWNKPITLANIYIAPTLSRFHSLDRLHAH